MEIFFLSWEALGDFTRFFFKSFFFFFFFFCGMFRRNQVQLSSAKHSRAYEKYAKNKKQKTKTKTKQTNKQTNKKQIKTKTEWGVIFFTFFNFLFFASFRVCLLYGLHVLRKCYEKKKNKYIFKNYSKQPSHCGSQSVFLCVCVCVWGGGVGCVCCKPKLKCFK